MTRPEAASSGLQVFVLSPLERDILMAERILHGAGFQSRGFTNAREMIDALSEHSAGMLMIAVEALYRREAIKQITDLLHEQAPWSDLPVTILTTQRINTPIELEAVRGLEHLHSITFLDRPVRIAAMVSTVRAGLQARKRQYQVRDLLYAAEDDIRQRDEFLAMLSHELRNPLSAIKNAAQIVNMNPENAARVAPVLDRQVDQLNRMVNDLLDVARITNGKVELKKSRVDLVDVVRGAVESVNDFLDRRRHTLVVDLAEMPVMLVADPARLMQVYSNLLHNAAKFTEDGGRIRISLGVENGRAVVAVEDNGAGLECDAQLRVFELFAQGKRDIDRSQGGLGIGLTIVRRLVHMHGGTVTVHSDGPGTGCVFSVFLPLDQPPAGTEKPRTIEDLGDGKSCRVLVVDDNHEVAESMGLLLELMGHEIRILHKGEEAVEYAQVYKPDFVLLDLGMPGMNGFEVAQALRSMPERAEMTVVAVTGYGGAATIQKAHESGFDHHLLKPVELQSLRSLFNRDPCLFVN